MFGFNDDVLCHFQEGETTSYFFFAGSVLPFSITRVRRNMGINSDGSKGLFDFYF